MQFLQAKVCERGHSLWSRLYSTPALVCYTHCWCSCSMQLMMLYNCYAFACLKNTLCRHNISWWPNYAKKSLSVSLSNSWLYYTVRRCIVSFYDQIMLVCQNSEITLSWFIKSFFVVVVVKSWATVAKRPATSHWLCCLCWKMVSYQLCLLHCCCLYGACKPLNITELFSVFLPFFHLFCCPHMWL